MDYLIHYIEAAGYFGYAIFFIIIFLESFPLTFFFPGDSLLFFAGFLSYQGYFNLPILVVVLYAASICGYLFSYYVGGKVRHIILTKKQFLWVKPSHIDKTQAFFEKYGAKTIIIGRFVPIVRSFSPALAGAADMNYKKFIRYTLEGGFLWSAGLTAVGYYLGKIFPNAHVYITPIVIIIILVSAIPIFIEYFSKNKKKTGENNEGQI